jgi:hypothetical protein
LIDFYHELSQHSETIERLRDLTPRLICRWNDTQFNNNLDVEGTVQNQHTLNQFFQRYDSFTTDLHATINLGVTEFGQVSELVLTTVCDACNRSALPRTSLKGKLYHNLVGGWFSQSSLAASLQYELAKTADALPPTLAALDQSALDLQGSIKDDLERVREILDGAKLGVNGCGTLVREEVERLGPGFACIAGPIDKSNSQRPRPHSSSRKPVGRSRCLCTAGGDLEEVALEAWRFHVSLEDARERWESMR